MSDDVEVGTVSFTNGMLVVELKRIIPITSNLKFMIFQDEVSESPDHPVTLFNGLLVGFLIIIGLAHNHAHYTMEVDADSYVRIIL